MTAPGDPLLVRIVLGLYPARWRERYGEEFAALLSDMTAGASRLARIRAITDAMLGGIDTRLRFLRGNAMPGRVRMTLKAAVRASLRSAAAAPARVRGPLQPDRQAGLLDRIGAREHSTRNPAELPEAA